VGFEKPQRFVQRARKTGQNICCIGIAGIVRRVDASPNRVRDGAITLDQRREMVNNF
jgi:hypothetical protein